jgi:hypothetical protein
VTAACSQLSGLALNRPIVVDEDLNAGERGQFLRRASVDDAETPTVGLDGHFLDGGAVLCRAAWHRTG